MNTKALKYLVLLYVGLLLAYTVSAQSTYQIGLLPSLNLNKKLEKDWSLNLKIESRQLIQRGNFEGFVDPGYEYVLTDNTLVAAKKTGFNSRVAGGYLMRFRGKELIQRAIQQYSVVQKMNGYRLAHRFVTDQTFVPNQQTEFRLRYRLTSEIPLNGQSVDQNELYLKINNEVLNSWRSSDYDLEIRVIPFLGWIVSANTKIEFGLDYRVNSFLTNNARHTFWTALSCFIDL